MCARQQSRLHVSLTVISPLHIVVCMEIQSFISIFDEMFASNCLMWLEIMITVLFLLGKHVKLCIIEGHIVSIKASPSHQAWG